MTHSPYLRAIMLLALGASLTCTTVQDSVAEEEPKFQWKLLKITRSCWLEGPNDTAMTDADEATLEGPAQKICTDGTRNGGTGDSQPYDGRSLTPCLRGGGRVALGGQGNPMCWSQTEGPLVAAVQIPGQTCLRSGGSVMMKGDRIVCIATPRQVRAGIGAWPAPRIRDAAPARKQRQPG